MLPPISNLIDTYLPILVMAPLAVTIIVLYVKVLGLRSFSKMTSFDFVITLASASILANAVTALDWQSYWRSMFAIGILFLTQYAFAKMRSKSHGFRALISNEPVLLFSQGEFIESALSRTRVTKEDIWAKIREANGLEICKVQAVVLETTGDISVLHGSKEFDNEILKGVETCK